jgi:hypothetical protein
LINPAGNRRKANGNVDVFGDDRLINEQRKTVICPISTQLCYRLTGWRRLVRDNFPADGFAAPVKAGTNAAGAEPAATAPKWIVTSSCALALTAHTHTQSEAPKVAAAHVRLLPSTPNKE